MPPIDSAGNQVSQKPDMTVKVISPYLEATGNPFLGRRVNVIPPEGPADVFDVRVKDDTPITHVITLDSDIRVPGGFGGPATAGINWSTGLGNRHIAFIDIGKGIQLTIAATQIRCTIINEAFMNPLVSLQSPIAGWGSVTSKLNARFSRLTKTVYGAPTQINGGPYEIPLMQTPFATGTGFNLPWADIDFPGPPVHAVNPLLAIPPFAKEVRVARVRTAGPAGSGLVRVDFFHNATVIGSANTVEGTFVEIPGGTTSIGFVNGDANPQIMIPQFNLAL